MTAREFIRNYTARIELMRANRREETLRITLDLLAQVRLRVQSEGRNFREQPFPPYTPQYAKRRALAGYQVDYVDFTRTGRLWASVRPEVIRETELSTTIEVSSRTEADRDKLRGAIRKRGNILYPADSELAIANESNRRRLEKYLTP